MSIASLIVFLLIGAVAGWLAGLLVRGRGFGLIGDIVVGIIGAFIGGFLLTALGLAGLFGAGIIGAIVVAFIGAAVLLFIIKLIKKA
ncbi:MAG: GlsB/YeaQ/YmgE family stress response membrane protein [Acidithiobacillus sp.]|uniref:GlsB/YeaQ/YmgE family stress response membrane protein n=2 Tax=Acidithiobacillus sp. TaxID=1872118 RepID=UPI0025B973B2|nr:GlsB/YeaQ/YmgE family stress response membrane protein [Acidithiobacillus sp.]